MTGHCMWNTTAEKCNWFSNIVDQMSEVFKHIPDLMIAGTQQKWLIWGLNILTHTKKNINCMNEIMSEFLKG